MGNFKNAKEFDRDPLRKSDFYQKVLKPTSGKSLGERWKGRRQSDNVSEDTSVADLIDKLEKATGESSASEKKPRVKKTNPNSKSDRLNTQVTPGKWITK